MSQPENFYILLPNGLKLTCHSLAMAEQAANRYRRAGVVVEILDQNGERHVVNAK